MKKRIISMLLAGMMVLNSAVVYADADITGDYTTYADTFDSEDEVAVQSESAEENASADDNANIGVNETSVAENNADVAFTDGDSDEVDITEENPEDVSSQGETDENEEIQFAEEADDIFSENKVAVQDVGTTTASGTLATGVIWSLSENGNLQFSGSGAIEKDDGQDNYPWDMTQVVTVTIQSGITGIGSGAFADGTKLTKVFINADSLRTVSADAFKNCSNAGVNLYYSGNAPTAIPAFTGTSKVYTSVYYKDNDPTWTDEYRAAYANTQWVACCQVNGVTAKVDHVYVRDSGEIMIQTDGNNYPTPENMAYYNVTCSECGNKDREYNDCIHCIDATDLQSDHPYNTETSTDWTVSMEGAEEIILTFDEKTKFETNYDDFFYIYKEDGELYQKFINDQLAGKTVIVPGNSVTLRLTTDYSTDDWGFAVTKAYGTTHEWDAGVITKPAERDQTGILVRTCQKCGEVVEEVIPAPYIVCGDDGNIFWGITPDHVLELSMGTGEGTVERYSYRETLNGHQVTTAPWGEYEELIEGVRVKEGITDVIAYSFYGLSKLKWAEMADSVTRIGDCTFACCTTLKSAKIPENVIRIDGGAFKYCTALETISIPERTTTIGYDAFANCTALRSINIPKNLNRCANSAFWGCINLRALYIEDLLQWLNMEEWPTFDTASFNYADMSINYYVAGAALENLVIPKNVTKIRKEAFIHGHNIKTVTFHENIEYIEQSAFSDCVNLELTNDKLPNYLKSIGNEAFRNCKKISKVGIPSSVVNIGNSAFSKCSGMTQCIFAEDIQIDKISASAFRECENLESIEIPLSVTTIEEEAFGGCHTLKRVRIPAGVTSIKSRAFALHAKDGGNIAEFTFLGDFGDFNSMFAMDEYGARNIIYYACNNTWTSSEAQGFFNGLSNTTPNPIHMSKDYTVITKATCITDGEKSFTCDNCGKAFTDVIPATGHKLTSKEHKDATCIEKGYDIQVCSVCKEEFKTELDIDPNAHQYGEGKVIEPNCSREGYTLYTCALCGNTKREGYKPSTDHAYEDIVVPATCQMQGYTRHQCKNCGYSYDDTWTEPLEHDYEATVTKPTCTERGYTYYSCKNCGYSYRDNFVGALGHKYTKEVIKPTCIDEGYTRNTCSICGLTYNSNYREATGHDYESVVTPPTCTERGYTTYTCKNENCDNVIVSDYRSALGHSYEAVTTDSTCTEKGFTTYTCVTCGNSYTGDETDLAPHKWDKGTITKQPTYLEKGLKAFKCLNCEETYTEDIPALVQTDLSDCTITLSYRKTVYNGKEKTPEVVVKNHNGTVGKTEYSVTYAKNINAGNAEVIVNAKPGNVSITGETTIPFTIAKAKQNITAETESESVHVNTEEPITVNGLGEVSIVSENEEIAVVTEEKMIRGKKKGTAYLKISAAGDDNHEAAETKIQISVNEDHVLKITDTVLSTCCKQGSVTSVCELCGKTFVEKKALDLVNGHAYEVTSTVPPQCEKAGYTTYTCSRCGDEYTDHYREATGHDYDIQITEPTCTERGHKNYTCKKCGKTKTEDFKEATGHDYVSVVTAPTCTEKGYTTYSCTKCDYVVTDDYREPLQHNYKKTVTPSSCTKKGFTTYTCTRCKSSFSGDETDLTPHKWDEGTVTESTYLKSGKKEFKCLDCNETYTEEIPALGQTELKDCSITLAYQQTVYDGKEKAPEVIVKNDNGVVSKDNYTVSYVNNTNAGEATVTITAKEGDVCITGEAEKTFTISKKKQSVSAVCTVERIHVNTEAEVLVENGIGQVLLTTEDEELVEIQNSHITGKKAGLALINVSVSGDDNHEPASSTVAVWVEDNHIISHVVESRETLENGDIQYDDVQKCTLCKLEIKREHKILKNINSEECEIRFSSSVYVFDGNEVKPEVSVSMAGKTLTEGNDYRLEYQDNDRIGEASVSVIGIGQYTNAKKASFRIIEKPKQPVLQAVEYNNFSTVLTWNEVENAEGYYVYRKVSNGSWSKVGTTESLSFEDKTAKPGMTYTYTVSAYIDLAEGSYDEKGVTVSYLNTPAISTISNAASGINITWKRVDGAAKYRVFRKKGTESWTRIADTGSTNYTDRSAASGTTYAYTVRCIKADGKFASDYDKNGKSLIRLSTGNVKSIANAAKGMRLTWTKINGAQGYIIYRAYGSGAYKAIKTITSGTTLNYTDTSATVNGGKYSYAVCGYRGSVKGVYTGKSYYCLTQNRISSVTNSAAGRATVAWSQNAKATGYQVNYKTGNTQKTVTVKSYKTLRTVLSSLKRRATYSVKVRSYKTISKVNYYSEWSAAKNIRINK